MADQAPQDNGSNLLNGLLQLIQGGIQSSPLAQASRAAGSWAGQEPGKNPLPDMAKQAFENPLANVHKDVTAQVYKKAVKDTATQMQQAGVDPATAIAQAHQADLKTGLHQDDPAEGNAASPDAAKASPQQSPIGTQTPFDGPLGVLKAIMPFPFGMQDLMKQGWQQGQASTPQGALAMKEAENALPLSTEQQSTRELSILGGQREAAQNQLADYHNQVTELAAKDANAHAEANAAMATTGWFGKTKGRGDILKKLQDQIATNEDARKELNAKIKEANNNLFNTQKRYMQLSSRQASAQQSKLPSELQSLARATGAKITRTG